MTFDFDAWRKFLRVAADLIAYDAFFTHSNGCEPSFKDSRQTIQTRCSTTFPTNGNIPEAEAETGEV